MKKQSKSKQAIGAEPTWLALTAMHGMHTAHLANRYADEQALYTYMAPVLCASDGRMLRLEILSHPEVYRRCPEMRLLDAMARYTKDLLTAGHPALRQFVKRYGFAPNVVLHVGEASARPLVAVGKRPSELQGQFSSDVVMSSYYTRTRQIVVMHPLVQDDETGHLVMEPQPFPAEDGELFFTGRLAIHG